MNLTTDPTFQLLIDADIIYHRAAFSCEDTYDFGDEAIRTVDDNDVIELFDGMLLGIFGLLKPASYICCCLGTISSQPTRRTVRTCGVLYVSQK